MAERNADPDEKSLPEERKKAVALQYDKGRMKAPRVTAKGRGVLAERLVALAKENGVPVQEDRLLVEALEAVDVGRDVPIELYQVVAEILVTVYRAERERSTARDGLRK
jgi:flagellar biosynthesis protein